MTCFVDLRPLAQGHATSAHEWWQKNRPAAPDLFADEFAESIRILEQTPDVGKIYRRRGIPHLRRLLMLRTQFHIYYVHVPDQTRVFILAIWNALRRRGPPLRPVATT